MPASLLGAGNRAVNKTQLLFSWSSHSTGEVLDNTHVNKQLATVISEMIRGNLGGGGGSQPEIKWSGKASFQRGHLS